MFVWGQSVNLNYTILTEISPVEFRMRCDSASACPSRIRWPPWSPTIWSDFPEPRRSSENVGSDPIWGERGGDKLTFCFDSRIHYWPHCVWCGALKILKQKVYLRTLPLLNMWKATSERSHCSLLTNLARSVARPTFHRYRNSVCINCKAVFRFF